MKPYLLHFKWQNFGHLILILIQSALIVGASLNLALMTNQLVLGRFYSFLVCMFAEIGIYLLYLIFGYIVDVHEAKVIQDMSKLLRERYIINILQSPFHEFQQQSLGNRLSVLTNDIQLIESKGFASFYQLCSTLFTTIFSILALMSYNYKIVVVTLLLTVCLTYLPRPFAIKMQEAMNKLSEANDELLSGISDQLSGYSSLYYARRKIMFLSKVQELVQSYILKKINFTRRNAVVEGIMALFSIFAQMTILLVTGFLITLGQMSLGTISSVGQISGNIFNSLTTLNQLQVSIRSVQSLFDKFDIQLMTNGQRALSSLDKIELQRVSYAFDDRMIFSDVNLTFKKGGKYALVGPSGSGKSTLINIILGNLKDYKGQLFYNGQDAKLKDEESVLSHCTYLGPQTHIFKDTLRQNMTLWDDTVTDEQIKSLLIELQLRDLFERLDEKVSPEELSEGQKQRIGLARAFLRGNSFYIMDEAMANLDRETALSIEETILKDPKMTYITITHHLSEGHKVYFDDIIDLGTLGLR